MEHWTGIAVVLTCVLGVSTESMAQAAAPAVHYAPSSLLAIDQNRTTVIDRIVVQWGERLAQSEAGLGAGQLRSMLGALRADHLLAASLAGTLDGLRAALVDVVGYFKAPTAPLPAMAAAIADLTTRISKLEGQITAADIVGTYRLRGLQNELSGGAGVSVSSYVFGATITLAANGTYTFHPTLGESGNTLRLFTNPPMVVDFVGAGSSDDAGNWSYSNGVITIFGGNVTLDVGAGGKVMFGNTFNHSDGTDVILVLTRL